MITWVAFYESDYEGNKPMKLQFVVFFSLLCFGSYIWDPRDFKTLQDGAVVDLIQRLMLVSLFV